VLYNHSMSKMLLTFLAALHTIAAVYIIYLLGPSTLLAFTYATSSGAYAALALINIVLILLCGISAGTVWLSLSKKSLSIPQGVAIVVPYILIALLYSFGNF